MSARLLTAHDTEGHVHLVVGSNSIASARCSKSLEVGAMPIVVTRKDADMHYSLQAKVDSGQVKWVQRDFEDRDLKTLGREEVDGIVDMVFVTFGGSSQTRAHISGLCRRLRIPVNVVDSPNLSTFTLLTTHSDGPLQIGVTTSGKGCKLASRVKREVASALPPNLGPAIERLGAMRRKIWEQDHKLHDLADIDRSDDEAPAQSHTFNRLVTESDINAAKARRIRWLSQICEYWPLRRLAAITDDDVDAMLQTYSNQGEIVFGNNTQTPTENPQSVDHLSRPRICLVGSGPGSPHLLTVAAYHAIKSASVVLTDKLVPGPVLDLIPRRTTVHIARKFPGNADAAQDELLALGLAALKRGEMVVRLKQGDPYIFGRGGEEYTYFRKHGYTPIVIPGITSSLSAPLFASIPPTHRSVADQVLVCTGTGRKGAAPEPPPFVKSQTVVFLMALHRLSSLVGSLTTRRVDSEKTESESLQNVDHYAPWPTNTPCAVLERASCPDQRVIRTTLQHVVAAVEEEGSRPPGLLVVGYSCEVLKGAGAHKWVVEEGFAGFEDLTNEFGMNEFLKGINETDPEPTPA